MRPRSIALAAVLLGLLAGDARADAPAGAPAFRYARAAWDRGALKTAEPLYREAIEKGGLAPNEVLEGYVRLGAIRSALGKKDSAVAAFRAASILDASFVVPRQAGRKGASFAQKAKKDTAKIGSIQLTVDAPKEVRPGAAFTITATLDKAHVPIVSRFGLSAKDGTTGKEITLDAAPDASVEFEIGSELTLPGASILVRVDALDKQLNRLASAEERVRVPEKERVVVASAGASARAKSAAPVPASAPDVPRGGRFWSSAWPYVIGGAAVIGAGTAVYFGTRPAEAVSVGQVDVRAQ